MSGTPSPTGMPGAIPPIATGQTPLTPIVRPTPPRPPARDTVQLSQNAKPQDAHPILGLVSPADTVEEAQAGLQERIGRVVDAYVAQPLHDWTGFASFKNLFGDGYKGPASRNGWGYHATAQLRAGAGLEHLNRALTSARVYSGVGTDYRLTQHIGRKGDYDFQLLGLSALAQEHFANPALSAAARQNLMVNLLNQEGNDHLEPRWLLGLIPETENHLLMTETARYLKNELVHEHGRQFSAHGLPAEAYDNEANGFNAWFVNHLSEFARTDFDEYNSRPYQAYTVRAIQNLHDYADDPRVQKSAHILLDYISARFALQSSDLRRAVPFRRRAEYAGNDNLWAKDSQSARFALLAGNYHGAASDPAQAGLGAGHMQPAAMSRYRVPEALLDLMVDKGSNPYFAVSRHRNTEIVYAEENFLISAGGHHQDFSRLPFSDHEDGIAMPTVVMLKGAGPQLSDMIRFEGRGDDGKVNNTGVYENVAFGIRPVIPETMLAEARRDGRVIEQGPWTFLDVGEVYVAMWRHSLASPDDYAPTVGFSEVIDKSEAASLRAFAEATLQRNGSSPFQHYGANRYTTSRGKTIEFVMAEPLTGRLRKRPPNPDEVNTWLVRRVWDGDRELPIETRLDRWPLTDARTMQPEQDGENNDYVMRADGTGQILINNPRRNQSLLMSLADQENPIRIEQAGEAVNLTETGQVQTTRRANGIDAVVTVADPENVRYLSLKWDQGSRPERVRVYIQREGEQDWTLAEDRRRVYTSDDHAFRTDFDLADGPRVQRVRFAIDGSGLALGGAPEVYRGY